MRVPSLPEDYKLERPRTATIKIKPNADKTKPKSPDVRGFIAVTPELLELWVTRMKELEKDGEQVMFLSVALWDASSGEYPLTGHVSHPVPFSQKEAPPLQSLNSSENIWY